MASKTLEGGCGCGAVRYRLTDEPIFVNNCHCRLCQRQTGTGFGGERLHRERTVSSIFPAT